ncbi:MAG: hypothetical protein ABIR80_10295 [Opitutaceae bacterium]
MNPYSNSHSKALETFRQRADDTAAKAAGYLDNLAVAKAELAAKEAAFVASLEPGDATALARANERVNDLTLAADAIENSGGATEARARVLDSVDTHATFAKGFGERDAAIQKLIPSARKEIGKLCAALTEEGLSAAQTETYPEIVAWRSFEASLTAAKADAIYGGVYSEKRGVGYRPEDFDTRFARLVAPLPQAPASE